MTGPDHYRQAEALIRQADSIPDGFPGDQYAQTIAVAQVHATLAVAASVALGPHFPHDMRVWREVAGVQPAPAGTDS